MTDSDRSVVHSSYRAEYIHPPWIFSRYRPRVRGPGPGLIWEYFLSRLTGSWEVDALQVKYIVGMYSRKYSTFFFRGRPANFPIERTIDIAEEDLTALKRTVPPQESLDSTQIPSDAIGYTDKR